MVVKPQAPLHPACEPLAALLGFWRGRGQGSYPNVKPFAYLEEVSFAHVGKPFLVYSQKTVNPETNQPMHSEFGYWRPVGDGSLEVVLIHPTGVTEVTEGSFQEIEAESEQVGAERNFEQARTEANGPQRNLMIQLRSTSIGLTGTAKEVTQLNRVFTLDTGSGDLGSGNPGSGLTATKLSYRLEMAAVGQPLQFHLMAELEKQAS